MTSIPNSAALRALADAVEAAERNPTTENLRAQAMAFVCCDPERWLEPMAYIPRAVIAGWHRQAWRYILTGELN